MEKSLQGIVFHAQPFMAQAEEMNGVAKVTGGLFGIVFLLLASELGFSYNLTVLHGYRYGAFRNGRWDGMIGHLSRNEVDMTVSELSLTQDRLELLDYSSALDSIGRKIYIRKLVEKKAINWRFFAAPFSPALHFTMILWVIMMTILLWAATRTKDNYMRESLRENFWVAFSTILNKGAHLIPGSKSGKIVFVVFSFTFLCLYCAYSATLISQLSINPPVKIPFKDLQDFVNNGKTWKGGPIKGDLTQLYMEKTCPALLAKGENVQCELLVQLWTKVIAADKENLPTSFQEGLDRVLKERFAFIASSPGVRNYVSNNLEEIEACNIFEMPGDYVASNVAFGFRKKFPHKHLINYKLLQIHSSGILSRLRKIWFPQVKQCLPNTEFHDASINDVGVAPLIWVFGVFFSAAILSIEILIGKTKEGKN